MIRSKHRKPPPVKRPTVTARRILSRWVEGGRKGFTWRLARIRQSKKQKLAKTNKKRLMILEPNISYLPDFSKIKLPNAGEIGHGIKPWLWAWIEPHGGVTHPISLAKAMDWYKREVKASGANHPKVVVATAT
jgi:hypothetical protein